MAQAGDRRARLRDACGGCAHPWSEHPGGLHEASLIGVCGHCVYEAEHHGRAETCRVHVPDDVLGEVPRVVFAVALRRASRAAGLTVLLDAVRPDATAVAFDLPERDGWPAEARAAAAVLRSAADLPAAPAYATVDWLPVDDAVWAAFRAVAPLVHSVDVWDARGLGYALLDAEDDGAALTVALTPDQYAAVLRRLPADALTRITQRATLARRLRVWRPGRREPGQAWGMAP